MEGPCRYSSSLHNPFTAQKDIRGDYNGSKVG